MEEQYQLICSYVKQRYYISTIHRQASTVVPMWYFETMAWEWDSKTKELGNLVLQEDSGNSETMALLNHGKHCESLINNL